MKVYLAIATGALLGAFLRYGFSLKLNPVFPALPLGTVTENLLGGFLMGVVVFLSLEETSVPKEVLIGMSTGFLGCLTTFSTFSAEVFKLLMDRQYYYTMVHLLVHVVGAILMVFFGFFISKAVARL